MLSPMSRCASGSRTQTNRELEQTRDAHANYYLAFAEEAESVLPGADQAAWADRLGREVGNLRAALEWLLERKRGEEALRLAAALRQFWSLPGYRSRGRRFLEQAQEVSEESQASVSPTVRAKEGVKLYREIGENDDLTERVVRRGERKHPRQHSQGVPRCLL
jgi:hypothetical protein